MLFIKRDTRPTSALLSSAAQSLILPWVYSSSPAGADDGPALRAPGPGADLCVRPQRGLSVLGKPRLQRPERQGEDAGKRSPPSPSVVGDFLKEKNNTSTERFYDPKKKKIEEKKHLNQRYKSWTSLWNSSLVLISASRIDGFFVFFLSFCHAEKLMRTRPDLTWQVEHSCPLSFTMMSA